MWRFAHNSDERARCWERTAAQNPPVGVIPPLPVVNSVKVLRSQQEHFRGGKPMMKRHAVSWLSAHTRDLPITLTTMLEKA